MANLSRQYCAYFGEATEVWKQHVIGVTIEAFDQYRDSVCQTLQNVAQDLSRPVSDGSPGGQDVNMEMLGNVQTAMENAQHLAQQRIADTLAQTFNPPPPIILSTVDTGVSNYTNQSIQVNVPGKSTSSQGGVISSQNDGDSLDALIKSEVDSSSESECESDSDDEVVQVKEEPNEEENIVADGDGDFVVDEHMDDNDNDNDDHHDLENQTSGLGEQNGRDHEGEIIDGETDEDDCDYSEEQEGTSEAVLGVAGPSTSAQERQGTRRMAKRQIVSGKASKRQRIRRDSVTPTVPLSIITKKLKCTVPGCKKMVKSKSSMNRHLLSKHQLKEFRCLVRGCHGKVSTSFSTLSQLNNHRRQVHDSLTEWTCKCSKNFSSYQDLSTHYWRYHELGHFACSKDGCPVKSTTTRAKLQNHQKNHLEAKYHCPVDNCGWSFKQKGNLNHHLLTHSEERPFPCPGCDKSFARKDYLTTHLLTHSGERSFPCPECGKSFIQKSHLTAHLRIHRNDKCFSCTWAQCPFSATDRSTVIKHIRTSHFKLPRSKGQQRAAGIIDDRDARDFLAKN